MKTLTPRGVAALLTLAFNEVYNPANNAAKLHDLADDLRTALMNHEADEANRLATADINFLVALADDLDERAAAIKDA